MGSGGRACSPETERKSIWPKSTRQPPEFYSRHNHLRPIYRYKRAVADQEREKEYEWPESGINCVFFPGVLLIYTIYAKHTTFPPCFICVLCILYTPLLCGGVSKIRRRRRRSREMAQGCTQLTKWKTIRTVDSPQCNIIYHYRAVRYRYGNEHAVGRFAG